MEIRKSFILICLIFGFINSQSQNKENSPSPSYLGFQTGGFIDNYNSFGIRTFFEYQKDVKKNLQYGISYEHSRHLYNAATDHFDNLETNLSLLSYNFYYKIKLYKDRVFWTSGLGLGVVHADWKNNDKIGAVVNASITLNIRIAKNIFIETSPLVVLLPSNRIYYSPMNASSYSDFLSGTIFPIGIKFKL